MIHVVVEKRVQEDAARNMAVRAGCCGHVHFSELEKALQTKPVLHLSAWRVARNSDHGLRQGATSKP